MLIGYARASEADAPETLDKQLNALVAVGVDRANIYTDTGSIGPTRPGLDNCLCALRAGDTLVVWKLDRFGGDLDHLINLIAELCERDIGLKVLTGKGAVVSTLPSQGDQVTDLFDALSEFSHRIKSERIRIGKAAAKAKGRPSGRPPLMTAEKVLRVQQEFRSGRVSLNQLCAELGVCRQTIYRYVGPDGELRDRAIRLIKANNEPA